MSLPREDQPKAQLRYVKEFVASYGLPDAFAFFTRQDQHGARGASPTLYLSWGSLDSMADIDDDDDDDNVVLPPSFERTLSTRLAKAGLRVMWNGDHNAYMMVSV